MKAVLTILSGDRSGEKITLTSAVSYVLGREAVVDIPLPEKKVSRKHATLSWDGKDLILEDLKSLNGTFLNGSLIHGPTPLQDKDRFQIGSYLFEVTLVEQKPIVQAPPPEISREEEVHFTDPGVVSEELEFIEAPSTIGASITGKLLELPLADLLQMLVSTKRSGRLVIASQKKELVPNPPPGIPSLYIKDGDLVGAEIEDLKNEDAFYEILRWQNGYFALFPQVKFEWKAEIELPLEALLLEGFRRLDEEKTATIQFQPETTFEVCLDEPLSSLDPDELRIFQLIWKKKKMVAIWNGSHLDQKSTDVVVRKLLRSGYIRKH